jgi:serine/threonine protein kinase/WD40 repeat protein
MTELDLSGRTLGDFVLRERIGAGGHGTVYRCEQRTLGRDAVVKVLRPRRKDEADAARFMREAQLASRLDHPYSAHVYDFGVEEDGVRWIAMELASGITLGAWLKERGPMPLAQFVPLFEYVAEVVHAAHVRGIVHRDLKPSNIMVAETGGRLLPKLLDFGIAKLFDAPDAPDEEPPDHVATTARLRNAPPPDRTRTSADAEAMRLTPRGAVLGSAPYMSPEQWCDPWSVGPATDIYALGCLAHETLTGRTPFEAADARGYCDRHLRAEVPTLAGAFPPGVDRAIRRALEKSPEARHRSALDLAAEFRAALRAEPREQLRSAAQHWEDRERSPGFLWGREGLVEVARSVPQSAMSELECSFVAASTRRARRGALIRRTLVVVAVASAVVAFQYRSSAQTRLAEQQTRLAQQQTRLAQQESRAARDLAEARVTGAELEQGRAALLHGEPEALAHLAEAYRRAPAPATAFMLARAMQPRLNELARLPGTYGRMWWAVFSPDGSQVATADDRAAQVWNANTYQLLFTLPHGAEVYHTLYAPDGAWLLTVTEKAVRMWNATKGTLIRELAAPPWVRAQPNYYRAAISSDGRLVAAMDADGSATRVWDARSGEMVTELTDPHPDGFLRLAFSRTGYLATTGGNEVHVFDVKTWKRAFTVPGTIRGLAFDARGRLATGSAAGNVSLWAIPSGRRLRQLRPSGESVEAVAFSSDGEFVASGGRDGGLQVWRTGSGALRSQLNPRRSRILAVEFDPTSEKLLAAHADGTVVVADVAQGLPIAVLDGPRNALRTAGFGPGGRIVGASRDGAARLWDATSPYRQWSSEPTGDDCGVVIGAEPDGRFVAIGCGALPTRVWDTGGNRMLAELPSVTPIAVGGFTSAFPAVSAGGDRAAVARGNGVELYALPGGRLLRRIEHRAPVSAVAFARTGTDVVSGALDGSILVTRDDGTERALQASAGVDVAELLPDGRVVASDAGRRVRVFSPSGVVLVDLEMPVRMMSLRREGALIVALPSYMATAAPPLVIDVDRLRVAARLEGHTGAVFSARWLPQGRLITAGADGTARFWAAQTGTLLKSYQGGPGYLADAILTSDGLVIGGDADGVLRFWDAASGEKLWALQAHKSAVIGVHLQGEDIVTRGFAGEISRWRLPQSEAILAACARHPPCAIVSQ